MKQILLTCIIFIISSTSKILLFSGQEQLDSKFFECLKKQGINQISMFYGITPDNIFLSNIIKAHNVGFNVTILYVSCRGHTPDFVARNFRQNFGTNIIDKTGVLFIIDDGDKSCDWGLYSPESNCKYLQELFLQFDKYGFNGNVVTSIGMWKDFFGSRYACPQVSNTQLWWLPDQDQDQQAQDFAGYNKFGGWEMPSMKLLNETTVICDQELARIYYK